MAYKDFYCGSTGTNTNTGLSTGQRVKGFRRINKLVADYVNGGGLDTPRVFVSRYTYSSLESMDNAATTGIGNYANNGLAIDGTTVSTVSIPAGTGLEIVPEVPGQNWHFGDIRVIGTAALSWRRMYLSGGKFNFTGTGSITNVWAYCHVTTGGALTGTSPFQTNDGIGGSNEGSGGLGTFINTFVANLSGRIQRVWRGGAAEGASALDRYNEIWESKNLTDMGSDPTRMWTQKGLSPAPMWLLTALSWTG
jgi:hypothetical protein